jgi:hypothetical protein
VEAVRLSEFWIAMGDEFGEQYGRVLVHDLVLGDLGGRTGQQALADGVPAREVWLAIARAQDVPPSRWYGVGLREPRDTP